MNRVYNFSAGPSMLPLPVLERAAQELACYGDTGMSVMEMSHRSKPYEAIIESAEALLRELMDIPDNYKVMFLQGGASMQFAQVPLNLMNGSGKADYVDSGNFASLAIKEGKRFGDVKVVASSKDEGYARIPALDPASFTKDADYFYITTNNTIFGTRFAELPKTGNVPLVADMSSNILSQAYDVRDFGLIFAGAQKNVGPAGMCIVIAREDLLGKARPGTPTMLDYKVMADNGSMYNTPPTYTIYMAKLVFEWLKGLGGVPAMQKLNERKAALLYDALDASDYYIAKADRAHRSLMNVTFTTPTPEGDDAFVKAATKAGFVNLKGHRVVGGMRASIYNAMPEEGIARLVEFMRDFEKTAKAE